MKKEKKYIEYILKAITYQEMIEELDYWALFAFHNSRDEIITNECALEVIRTCAKVVKDINKKVEMIIK